MIENNFGFSWSTYFHPNQYTPDFLQLMKKAGCHTIIIGIESKNFEQLRKMGRVFSEEKLIALIAHANKLKINICGDFIIGLPDENEADVQSTIEWSQTLQIDFASFNIATPLPNTSIRTMAINAGRMEAGQHGFDTTGYSKLLESNQINKQTGSTPQHGCSIVLSSAKVHPAPDFSASRSRTSVNSGAGNAGAF